MNAQEISQQQNAQALEQEQLIGFWIKRHGISRNDLLKHPQIDDVIFLLKFRTEFQDMNNFRKRQFERIWSWVYQGKYAIKAKHLKQLQAGAEHTIRKRNRLNQQRLTIKTIKGQ